MAKSRRAKPVSKKPAVEHKAGDGGDLSWPVWYRALIERLGDPFKSQKLDDEKYLEAVGTTREDALECWGEGWSVSRYIQARKLERSWLGAVDQHDHANGFANCLACHAESKAERVGGISYEDYLVRLCALLRVEPAATKMHHCEQVLASRGVDVEDAKKYWVVNYTADAYFKLRPALVAKAATREEHAEFIPDATVEVCLTTKEVFEQIGRWAEACRTGKLNGSTVDDARDLVYAIQQDVEQWIEVLEDE